MWVPTDSTQIEQAAQVGDLVETPSFDAKSDLPKPVRFKSYDSRDEALEAVGLSE